MLTSFVTSWALPLLSPVTLCTVSKGHWNAPASLSHAWSFPKCQPLVLCAVWSVSYLEYEGAEQNQFRMGVFQMEKEITGGRF